MVECGKLDAMDLPAPDVMKIDVEGAERDLLAGAWAMIRARRPALLISLHITEEDAEKCAGIRRAIGYRAELIADPYEIRAVTE